MRAKRTLQAAALIAAAVLLGLLTVQGSYALWNASVTATAGTVTAASFDVALTAASTGTTTNMTLATGASANLVMGPTAALLPGGSVRAAVVVTNNSNAGGTFNTAVTVEPATVANLSGGSLAQYLTVTAKKAASAAECDTTSGYAAIATAGLVSPAVPKTGSTVFCFQVTLSSSAPSAVKGDAVNITHKMTARQLCGVPGGC
ncbi:MAG: SipW-dependent-type signal peptide-containing protein [Arthrobacter sp.]